VRSVAHYFRFAHLERVGLLQAQPVRIFGAELVESGNAARVAFNRGDDRSCIEKRPSETAGPRADLIDALAGQIAGDGRDARQQLPIQDEVLAKRLARAEAMPRDDFAQRLRL